MHHTWANSIPKKNASKKQFRERIRCWSTHWHLSCLIRVCRWFGRWHVFSHHRERKSCRKSWNPSSKLVWQVSSFWESVSYANTVFLCSSTYTEEVYRYPNFFWSTVLFLLPARSYPHPCRHFHSHHFRTLYDDTQRLKLITATTTKMRHSCDRNWRHIAVWSVCGMSTTTIRSLRWLTGYIIA